MPASTAEQFAQTVGIGLRLFLRASSRRGAGSGGAWSRAAKTGLAFLPRPTATDESGASRENKLVDEINLLTFPVFIGQGTRLFADTGPNVALDLVDTRTTPDG